MYRDPLARPIHKISLMRGRNEKSTYIVTHLLRWCLQHGRHCRRLCAALWQKGTLIRMAKTVALKTFFNNSAETKFFKQHSYTNMVRMHGNTDPASFKMLYHCRLTT